MATQLPSSDLSIFTRLAKRAARALVGASLAFACTQSFAAPELGVYRWDAPSGPANVDAFGQWLGRPASIAAAFEARANWDDIDGAAWQLGPWSQWVKAQSGRNLSLAVPMLPEPANGASLASCAAGQYDGAWANLANNLAYYGLHWAYLRLGWEMDGSWYSWSAPQGSGKEASYAGCFRRIVQVMRRTQPANQWKFVLNPTANWSRPYLDAIWPGDEYVDIVGLDLYDQSWAPNTYPYPSVCDSACRQTRQQNAWNVHASYLYNIRDFAIAHGKKMALPEWGVAIRVADPNGGGDNPFFIRKMHEFISNPANSVAYHVYWDVVASDLNAQLSGATRFPQSAAVFKELFGAALNTPPTVAITAPAPGQSVSGTIGYAANASDNAGVAGVEFYLNGSLLASDSTAPYGGSLVTTTLPNGSHTLRAVAFDATGLSSASQIVINVQNAVPTPVATPNPGTSYAATPYTGTAIAVPATFEAEDFDRGGQGVAYRDLSAGNAGGQYRTTEDVDIVASTDSAGGRYVVNAFQSGEWLSYSINVPASGAYNIAIRASNNYVGPGVFHIEVDGINVSGPVSVAKTGSWSSYQWFGKDGIQLAAGRRVIRIVSDTQYFNVNQVRVLAGANTVVAPAAPAYSYGGTPFTGTPIAVPATFEAENFDRGGQGVAYRDFTSGNTGGQYRGGEDVDIVASTDAAGGGYVVNNFQTGEWLSYTLNVPASGRYNIAIRASNNYAGPGTFHIEVDGVNVSGPISVAKTGAWSAFQWFGKDGIELAAGKRVIRIVSDAQYFNVNQIRVQAGTAVAAQ